MKRDFPSFLLYLFGFFLLWEWLKPVKQLTDTGNIEAFIIFLIIAFVMAFLKLKWIWQVIVKSIYIFVSINHLYFAEGILNFSWVKVFLIDFAANIGMVFQQNWNGLSDMFRTLLFFVLLWLMVYLIQYWLLRRKRIFLFFFMTLVYITILDTFTVYDATAAIVRTVVVGFAVMGLLTFLRITDSENTGSRQSLIRKWAVPLSGMIALSVLVGIAAPKAEPIWPDPVPYLTAAKDSAGGDRNSGVSRIGYGTNDDRLGGPFIADNTPVFNVEARGKNYWKVETKDVYTGKGWIASGATPIPFRIGEPVPIFPIPDTVEKTEETANVFYHNNNARFFIYPAGIQRISHVEGQYPSGINFEFDTNKEKISSHYNDANYYTVEYGIPKYKAVELRKTIAFEPDAMNEEFYQRYTQLPENLPPRIKQLTEEITANAQNWFDKARAVERYFSDPKYSYDQKNVALPGQEDDYVDQFLFDTMRGYCDNFSTSMAIMLRTIGIPTRWVKGFTGGEFIEYSRTEQSKQIYQITNNNAHSWVEVFIPEQGWVPFEPTKGFANGINIDYSTGQSSSGSQTTPPAPVKKPEKDLLDDAAKPKKDSSFNFKKVWGNTKIFFKNNWKWIGFGLILFAAFVAVLYRIRGKWVPYVLMVRYRLKRKDETINTAYLVLLNQLDRYGLKRKENQTLRNYARYVDSFFSTREMSRLTNCYEEYLYKQALPSGSWKDHRKLWENLIKKTIA